jgi:hypothetical protein
MKGDLGQIRWESRDRDRLIAEYDKIMVAV